MKTNSFCVGTALAVSLAKLADASIVVGDAIGIDSGNDAGSATKRILDAAPGNQTFEEINDLDGDTSTGVDFTFTNVPAKSGNNANSSISSNSPAISGNAQDDAFLENNFGQWALTFTGLNSSLTYDSTFVSPWTAGDATQWEIRNTDWQVGTTQLNTIAGDSAQSHVTFEDISINGDTLTNTSWDYNGSTVSTLSALTLTAGVLGSMLGLGLLGRRRRRCQAGAPQIARGASPEAS